MSSVKTWTNNVLCKGRVRARKKVECQLSAKSGCSSWAFYCMGKNNAKAVALAYSSEGHELKSLYCQAAATQDLEGNDSSLLQ